MTDLDKAVQDTAQFEGYKPAPYKDTRGLWTLGEGTCLETNPISGKDWKALLDAGYIKVSVTGAGARYLMRSKLAGDLRDLATRYPGFAALPGLVQTLLLEMVYQLGVDDLLGFTNFNNLVRSGQFAAAAADGRTTRWYSQTPARAELILKQLEGIQT
jgi:lysozyme